MSIAAAARSGPPRPARPSVLFLAGDLPWPPDGGGRIATLRVLEAFSASFAVDLLAIADSESDQDLAPLRRLCRSVEVVRHPFTFGRHPVRQLAVAVASTISDSPYRLRKFRSAAFRTAAARLRATHRYDLVHHDQFGVAPYVLPDLPSTMTHQNVESEVYRLGASRMRDPFRRAWLAREAQKLANAEGSILPRFGEVFVLADEDAELLAALGVDRTSVIPMPAPPITPPRRPPPEPVILSLGSMSWFGVTEGLLWFASEVLPRIRARVPDVRWHIVGAHPNRRIRQLGDQPGVEVHGHVTDLERITAASRIAIVPLNVAGGIRMKLLDMLAWRIPVVATTLAARGLSAADGEGLWRRDDPAGYADIAARLLTEDDLWLATVEAGATYVSNHHRSEDLRTAIDAGAARAIGHFAANRRP
jgi:glycosyltransferase involved in cell wall biosynthesis